MSDYERLTAALGKVRAQDVATFLGLHGSTGVIEDNLTDFHRAAVKMNVTDWVGTHVGAYEHGGAFWDNQEVLRYRYDNSPVTEVWFSFNHHRPELAALLASALRAEGLDAQEPVDDWSGVLLRLGSAR